MSDEQLPPTHQPWGSQGGGPEQPTAGSAGQPPYIPPPPNPYAQQDPYAAPPPNPYGSQPYQPAYAGGGLPDHPSATTALVLGIVSLVGIVFCGGLTLVLAPFAWVIGSRAVRAVDATPGRYGGREKAAAGRVMGIIGTVLLALGIVALIALIALVVAFGGSSTSNPSPVITHASGFANS
jgi:hypothetical protein